jgi:hypothetical protein
MESKAFELETQRDWSLASEEELLEGYKAMAADEEREREAFIWIESFVGECL